MAHLSLDALVIADLHYVDKADHVCPIERRKSDLGPLLVKRAFQRLRDDGVDVGLVVVLGDVVDNGLADGAGADLEAVAETARGLGVPVLAVPGNHDGEYGRFTTAFACAPGLHEVGGYGFLVFHDHVGGGDVTTRPPALLDLPARVAAQQTLPLVALQHNPLYVPGQHDYPYALTNAGAVLEGYRQAGIVLSLSGHYHPGQPLCEVRGVPCYTVPAACERPFRFAHVRLEGRKARVIELALERGELDE
jgi:3',5'-cyclic AMP phosphodiesterase CpdA